MVLAEIQKALRNKKAAEFGKIGPHMDCMAMGRFPNGDAKCGILTCTVCVSEVCYFYKKREEIRHNDNQ